MQHFGGEPNSKRENNIKVQLEEQVIVNWIKESQDKVQRRSFGGCDEIFCSTILVYNPARYN
jgi:hypothetical protein